VLPDPVEGAAHGRWIDALARQHAQGAQNGRMIPRPLRVVEAGRRGFGEHVLAVVHGESRELRQHLVPPRLARQPQPLAPSLRRLQAPAPIGHLERAVHGLGGGEDLLRALERRAEHVAACLFVPGRVARHELGGLEHHLAEALERLAPGPRPVHQFGVEDRVRLLPHEQRPDR